MKRYSITDQFEATQEQVKLVQERIMRAAVQMEHGADTFFKLFPHFKDAIDKLPLIAPFLKCPREFRSLIIEALEYEGVKVPDDIKRMRF